MVEKLDIYAEAVSVGEAASVSPYQNVVDEFPSGIVTAPEECLWSSARPIANRPQVANLPHGVG